MILTRALLLINVLLLQSYLIRFNLGPYPSNLQEVLIGFNALVFLYESIRQGGFKAALVNLKKRWITLGFIALTLISILAVPIINNLDFIRHLKFLFFAVVLTLIFLETFKTAKERNTGIRMMGIGALIFGLFSATYNLLGYNVALDFRLRGPLDSAVYLAFYITPFFIYFLINYFENLKEKWNILYAVLLGLLLIATRSMGAIGASLLIMLFYFFRRSDLKILKSKISKIVIAAIAIAVTFGIFYTKILPTIQTDYSSLDERGEIWLTSAELLKNPKTVIFGTGFGQFEANYIENVAEVLDREPLDYYVIQPHNIFLLFIFNYGILGLIFIVLLIYKTLKNLLTFKEPTFGIIICFSLLYFFIHGLIDTPIFKNDTLILFLLFLELGIANSLFWNKNKQPVQSK